MILKTSRIAILALPLLLAVEPLAMAQGAGVSVHSKTTPSSPPAAQQPAPPQPAAQQPVQTQPQQQAAPQQQGNQPTAAPNAVGAGNWSPKFSTAPAANSEYTGTPEQQAIIKRVNAYFNAAKNLEGNFLQTDADDKRRKGKFYLERPGKVRFDYALPSKQKIISDGRYLAIEDHDLNTTDRYPIESTPFRMLLSPEVDLTRDARIIAIDMGNNLVVVTVEDRNSDNGGQIRFFFDWPEVQLKEWIVSDAQGLNTKVELANLEVNKATDPNLFHFSPGIGMPKFNGSN
jgi:outer membrane lipoprotein-sorting protein